MNLLQRAALRPQSTVWTTQGSSETFIIYELTGQLWDHQLWTNYTGLWDLSQPYLWLSMGAVEKGGCWKWQEQRKRIVLTGRSNKMDHSFNWLLAILNTGTTPCVDMLVCLISESCNKIFILTPAPPQLLKLFHLTDVLCVCVCVCVCGGVCVNLCGCTHMCLCVSCRSCLFSFLWFELLVVIANAIAVFRFQYLIPSHPLWPFSCLFLWPSCCVHPFKAASFFASPTSEQMNAIK